MTHNYNFNNASSSAVAKNAVFAIITTLAINVILLLIIHYLRQTDVKEVKRYDLKEINITKIKKQPLNIIAPKEPPKPKKIKPKPKLLKRKLAKPPPPRSPVSMKPLSLNLNMKLLSMQSLSAIRISTELPDDIVPENADNSDTNLYDSSTVDQRPSAISRRAPIYPLSAKKLGLEGWVEVAFIVDENGNVINVEIINASSRRFHQAATTAVYSWKFKPGIKDQQKVSTVCRQKLQFTLN